MASGYIHITRKDLIFDEENGVVYWKNGARYLGEIAKAVLNEGEENETVKYYLKSAVTKKAILIDAGVIVGGGLYYFVTDDANFINVRIETADFSSDGGGDGVTVTFLLPESKYYTVRYVEENGDIKLFDVDGDAGTLVPDALPDVTDAAVGDALVLDEDKKPAWGTLTPPESKKYYEHRVTLTIAGSSSQYIYLTIVSASNVMFDATSLQGYISQFTAVECCGFYTSNFAKAVIMSIFNTTDNKCGRNAIKFSQDNDKTITIAADSTQAAPWANYTITDDIKEI